MTDNRTVSVSLKLLYDPASARAFAQIAKEAAKAGKEVSREVAKASVDFIKNDARLSQISGTAANLGAFGFAGRVGRLGSMAEGLQGLGAGGAARALQGAAPALAVAGGSARLAELAANSYYDRYSTAGQKARSFVRDVVPGGERAQRFVDAMTGRAAGMEQADIEGRFGMAAAGSRTQFSQFQLGFNPRQAGSEALARAYRGQTAVAPSVFDRTTSAGERAYREEQRILPLKQAEAKAERDMKVATAERVESQKELTKLTERANVLTKERGRLEREATGSGEEQQRTLRRIESVNSELEATLNQKRQAGEAVLGARGREAGAKGEFEKAGARTRLLGEAETLEGRVETAQAAGRRLGGMNQFDRAFGLQAARMIKERGSVDGLPSDYVQAALAFAPEFIGKIIEKTGQGTGEFKAGLAEFGVADFGTATAAADSKRAQELRREAAQTEFAIDAKTSESIAASGRDFGKFVGDVLKDLLAAAKVEILNQVRLGRNAN